MLLSDNVKSGQKAKMKTMGTQVVRGPQPGTLLDQGSMHRVVVRVAYQMDNNNNNNSDISAVPRHHAYCRYTLQVMPSPGKKDLPKTSLAHILPAVLAVKTATIFTNRLIW